MVEIDPKLAFWCKASVALHLQSKLPGVHIHVDGAEDLTSTKSEWVELYTVGPSFMEAHASQKMYFDVYVGCLTKTGGNAHANELLQGKVQAALATTPICVVKTDVSNTPTVCDLKLRDDMMKPLESMTFGIVTDKEVRLRRSTVEGHYHTTLV